MKIISITRHGVHHDAEIVRSAKLHNGKDVFLFHILDFKSPLSDKFVVAVTDGSTTFEWQHSHKIELAISLYLHILCCYA